jgi:indolepyruvate ferredoxin oxidoreductase, beta subunit
MKNDIILCGVGGQGILSIAAIIGLASLRQNLHIKQSEVHGMSQRGGAVQSHLRVSSSPVSSDLVPLGEAGMIISVEPMESLRYLPYLSPTGWIVTNSAPFVNIPNYPAIETVHDSVKAYPRHVLLDADGLAENAGSSRSSNMVVLGAASAFLDIRVENIRESIQEMFSSKGDAVVKVNIDAFELGRSVALEKVPR